MAVLWLELIYLPLCTEGGLGVNPAHEVDVLLLLHLLGAFNAVHTCFIHDDEWTTEKMTNRQYDAKMLRGK